MRKTPNHREINADMEKRHQNNNKLKNEVKTIYDINFRENI